MGIAWKIFWRPFFGRALAFVSLVSSIPVLGLESVCPWKGCLLPWPRIFCVLGLDHGFFLWPWPRALRPRLHLWWLVLYFCNELVDAWLCCCQSTSYIWLLVYSWSCSWPLHFIQFLLFAQKMISLCLCSQCVSLLNVSSVLILSWIQTKEPSCSVHIVFF